MKPVQILIAIGTLGLLLGSAPVLAMDPSLDVSQYAHTAWRNDEGFAAGGFHRVVQAPDGYIWLANEFGLSRFDGVRAVPWRPPAGEQLPSNDVRGLIVGRDGTLWLGLARGLRSWKNGKLTRYPQLEKLDVAALVEDHEGTVWAAGVAWELGDPSTARLCAIKGAAVQCFGSDGSFGLGITALYEDSRNTLWLGAGSGLWRWRPEPPNRYMSPELIQAIG